MTALKLTAHPGDIDSQGRKVLRFTPEEWQRMERLVKALQDIRMSNIGTKRRETGWRDSYAILEELGRAQ